MLKKSFTLFLVFLFSFQFCFFQKVYAAFDLKGVQLFKDNNICIIMAGSTTPESLSLSNLFTQDESVQSKISSSGTLCPAPPFFTGGALLSATNGISIQAQPTVQGLGRGILISEIAGSMGGVSSSGDPLGFSNLTTNLGITTNIFEITLPIECDVVDDDNDGFGASSDLSGINDFTFITCASTTGLTVACNSEIGLLSASNVIVPASGSTGAKVRFTISAIDSLPDANMIDSILIKFDSQDIFCKSTASGNLTATIIAKNAVDSPTQTENLGTVSFGAFSKAAKISYKTDTATSLKGEVSTNEVRNTPTLAGTANTSYPIEIEELDNEGFPLGGQSSDSIINPSIAVDLSDRKSVV